MSAKKQTTKLPKATIEAVFWSPDKKTLLRLHRVSADFATRASARRLVKAADFFSLPENEQRKIIEDLFPSNWLDPLLSGPGKVLHGDSGKWGCPDIEALIKGLKQDVSKRVLATILEGGR